VRFRLTGLVLSIPPFSSIFPSILVFGALGAQYFTDRFGRRSTFIIAAGGFILGVVIQAAAQNYASLMIGRFFVGLGVGTGLAVRNNVLNLCLFHPFWHVLLLSTFPYTQTDRSLIYCRSLPSEASR